MEFEKEDDGVFGRVKKNIRCKGVREKESAGRDFTQEWTAKVCEKVQDYPEVDVVEEDFREWEKWAFVSLCMFRIFLVRVWKTKISRRGDVKSGQSGQWKNSSLWDLNAKVERKCFIF